MFSRSTSTSTRGPHPFQRPSVSHRPSVSSRLSYAISTAEQGEGGSATHDAPAQQQIEEEIAEIKRYEVCPIVGITMCAKKSPSLTSFVPLVGLYHDRYAGNATRRTLIRARAPREGLTKLLSHRLGKRCGAGAATPERPPEESGGPL